VISKAADDLDWLVLIPTWEKNIETTKEKKVMVDFGTMIL
jgi:hypothetical protein